MLLMVRAQPTIIGAAILGSPLKFQRDVAGFEKVALPAEISGIAGHMGEAHAVVRTALLIEDIVALNADLGWDEFVAEIAERSGLAVENIGPALTRVGAEQFRRPCPCQS